MKQEQLKKVWKLMWPVACLLYISYFLFSAFSIYTAGVIGQFTDRILANDLKGAKLFLFQLLIAFVISVVIMPLLDLAANLFAFRKGLTHDKITLSDFMKKDFDAMRKFSTGTASQRLASDPITFRTSTVMVPTRCIAYMTTVIITAVLMLMINFYQSLFLFLLLLLSLTGTFLFSKRIAQYAEKKKQYDEDIRSDRLDLIQYRSFFHSNHIGKKEIAYLSGKFQTAFSNIFQREIILTHSIKLMREFFMMAGLIGLFVWNIVYSGGLSVGQMITMYSYFVTLRTLINQIGGFLKEFAQIPKSVDRINELTSEKEIDIERPLPTTWRKLAVKQGSFGYGGTEMVLKNLDVTIKRGELTHLKGQNGAGKSTLISILCLLNRLQSGDIDLDEVPLAEYSHIDWRSKIGVMNQFPDLFPGTIYENIRIADLTASEEQIAAVLRQAGIWEIKDRQLTGNKDEVSGGEQKKIALARLLLKNAEIIILDEPFTFLDEKGRSIVHQLLSDQEKTRILVSHPAYDYGHIDHIVVI